MSEELETKFGDVMRKSFMNVSPVLGVALVLWNGTQLIYGATALPIDRRWAIAALVVSALLTITSLILAIVPGKLGPMLHVTNMFTTIVASGLLIIFGPDK